MQPKKYIASKEASFSQNSEKMSNADDRDDNDDDEIIRPQLN